MVLWSNIVQTKKPPDRKDTKPPEPKKLPAKRNAITHTISSSLAAQKKIFERERRTHILRKLPPSTTLSEVIAGVTDTLNIVARDQQLGNLSLNDIVESVIRDTNDHRRYYITYVRTSLRSNSLLSDIPSTTRSSDLSLEMYQLVSLILRSISMR